MDILAKIDKPEMFMPDIENPRVNLLQTNNKESDHADDHLCCSTGDSSDGEQSVATNEVDFKVSCKLKQLGLRPPQQKRFEAQMHLRDEGLNDSSIVEAHDCDKETLLSLRNRRKSSDGGGGFFGEGSQEKDMQGKLSDDETLCSVFKKSRKLHSKPKDDRLEKIQAEKTNEDAGNGGNTDAMGRDGWNQSSQMDIAETNQDISIKHGNQEGTSVSEMNGSNISSFSALNNADDLPHQIMDDELADSGDDVGAVEILNSAVSRRKLRMVIDPEDED
ncbi:hypothetical protein Pint_17608 [Pistacia integerrima]|uniref:Uncharacterized protein n=1 Tax=Pistacia integerrima TaxID=434235 RepID=A0ACC0YVW1_9ROSI|nr:hypothetical protein Pint_17608 [Pistacia integerrima]